MLTVPVPIDVTACGLAMLYVFVDIQLDTLHFLQTVRHNFPAASHLNLVSTIQFVPTLQVKQSHGTTGSYRALAVPLALVVTELSWYHWH